MQNYITCEITRIISRNIKSMREAGNYTQREIAEFLGVSYQQIQKYEKGTNKLSLDSLHRLKEFYGLNYACFFEGIDAPKSKQDDSADKMAYLCFLKIRTEKDPKKKIQAYRIVSTLLS